MPPTGGKLRGNCSFAPPTTLSTCHAYCPAPGAPEVLPGWVCSMGALALPNDTPLALPAPPSSASSSSSSMAAVGPCACMLLSGGGEAGLGLLRSPLLCSSPSKLLRLLSEDRDEKGLGLACGECHTSDPFASCHATPLVFTGALPDAPSASPAAHSLRRVVASCDADAACPCPPAAPIVLPPALLPLPESPPLGAWLSSWSSIWYAAAAFLLRLLPLRAWGGSAHPPGTLGPDSASPGCDTRAGGGDPADIRLGKPLLPLPLPPLSSPCPCRCSGTAAAASTGASLLLAVRPAFLLLAPLLLAPLLLLAAPLGSGVVPVSSWSSLSASTACGWASRMPRDSA